jgi:DNA helicase II / ATP-dependent DNA helicase PcrA
VVFSKNRRKVKLDNNQENLKEEKMFLGKVLDLVDSELELETVRLEDRKDRMLYTRKEMWENAVHFSTDFEKLTEVSQYLSDVTNDTANYTFTLKRIEHYKKMKKSPYFGRFDFIEDDYKEVEKIYIGLYTLKNSKTQSILVYDWRAPISSIYYRYELGKVEYKAPFGMNSGEVLLKRRYKIQNSELKYFFDCDMRISDEILQEALSHNTSTKMKNIVQTIQKEQDVIIRDNDSELLIVQGVAGSGKTSIALHRIAFILYQGLGAFKSNNIIIVSPNSIFSKYISSVLPELGEENVEQTTFDELFHKCFETSIDSEPRNAHLESIIRCSEDNKRDYMRKRLEFKGSGEFVKIIDRLLWYFEHQLLQFEDIYFYGTLVENKQQLKSSFLNNKIEMPLVKRLKRLENKILETVNPIHRKRRQLIEKIVLKNKGHEFEVKTYSRLLSIKGMKVFTERLRKITEVDCVALYKRLFSETDLFHKITKGMKLPDEIEQIIVDTKISLSNEKLNYEDTAPLLYLKLKMEGSNVFSDIKQVVIDEAQDYYPMQYEIFKKVFSDAKFTVLGDVNQVIEKEGKLDQYNEVAQILDKPKTVQLMLNKSYRSSYEINAFNQKLLNINQEFISFDRHEAKPEVVCKETQELLDEAVINNIKEYLSQGYETIAVICKSQEQVDAAYERLKACKELKQLNEYNDEFEKGVLIIPVYMSKGLEFDATIVYGADKENYSNEFDRKLLYIACTRALHRLSLYYTGDVSPFIE